MKLKVITGIILALFLIGMLTWAFSIKPVKASGTIYIKADGSVDPPTAPILSVDNITYTFTNNIYDEIAVERNNIMVNGAGYTLQGPGLLTFAEGINLTKTSNVTIKNMKINGFWYGIWLENSSNNSITGNDIKNNMYGTVLYNSSNHNTISENNITNNDEGIRIYESSKCNSICGNNITANTGFGIWLYDFSSYNAISGNTIANNEEGVRLCRSSNYNIISGNVITANNDKGVNICRFSNCNIVYGNVITANKYYGIEVYLSSNNSIYHNNFINNTQQASIYESYNNVWHDDYPSGGNYWSNYTGVDLYSGLYQNETGSDGIGDTPHIINENNTDNYPLMGMFSDFPISSIAGYELEKTYHITTISNSTIKGFEMFIKVLIEAGEWRGGGVSLYLTGSEGTRGFCRFTIPKDLLDCPEGLEAWTIELHYEYDLLMEKINITSLCNIWENSTHTFIYVPYNAQEIWADVPYNIKEIVVEGTWIVPEFPTWTSILLILIILTIAITINKRRLSKHQFTNRKI